MSRINFTDQQLEAIKMDIFHILDKCNFSDEARLIREGILRQINDKLETKWEMFLDESYFHMWAVRPMGDRNLDSPRLFHFIKKEDAEAFKKLVEVSH